MLTAFSYPPALFTSALSAAHRTVQRHAVRLDRRRHIGLAEAERHVDTEGALSMPLPLTPQTPTTPLTGSVRLPVA